MNALFVSLYAATPHFETELELISDLLDDGHRVHVLRCTGQLGACVQNPEHRDGWCKLCVSKVDAGLGSLTGSGVRIEEMREVDPDPRLPKRFATVDELKTYTLDGAELGRGVYSTMCGRTNKDTRFDTRRFAILIRRELEAAHAVYVNVREAIAKTGADRVYIFNGRFATCHAAIEACRRASVTFFTHERGGSPDHYLLRENALPHDLAINTAEIETVWAAANTDKEAIGRRWFVERRNGVERSWESFTKAQTTGMLPEGFDRTKRNIAIFNSTMEEYASIKGWELDLYADEVVGVQRIVEALADYRDVHVYLRVHPHMKGIRRDDNYQLRAYAELAKRSPHLTVIWPESPVHTYELLDRSKVALTFGSTVGVEACYWGTPSVLAGHALYEKLDCAHRPKSHDELVALLLGEPSAKDQLGAIKYGYWESVRGTRFRKFKPTGLYTGEWLGKQVRASLSTRLTAGLSNRLGR
jgi:hypothetical protein